MNLPAVRPAGAWLPAPPLASSTRANLPREGKAAAPGGYAGTGRDSGAVAVLGGIPAHLLTASRRRTRQSGRTCGADPHDARSPTPPYRAAKTRSRCEPEAGPDAGAGTYSIAWPRRYGALIRMRPAPERERQKSADAARRLTPSAGRSRMSSTDRTARADGHARESLHSFPKAKPEISTGPVHPFHTDARPYRAEDSAMSAVTKIDSEAPSVMASLAKAYGMDRRAFEATLRATVMPGNVSNEQAAAFLLVAKQYNLNPFTKEIFAFPSRGGVQPIVSIDGWMKLINSHPEFDGMEFKDALNDKGDLLAVTCRIFRKDRSHPVEVTEYMAECRRPTDTWKQWPARMLRHKATIQAARYAFGFAGIMEPDEAGRMEATAVEAEVVDPALDSLRADLLAVAEEGTDRFRAAWKDLAKDKREALAGDLPTFKALAEAADAKGAEAAA